MIKMTIRKTLSILLALLILLPTAAGLTHIKANAAGGASLHNTRDPRSNIALAPLLVKEVKTTHHLSALKSTLPAVAILDVDMQNGTLGVTLSGKFVPITDKSVQVCDQVIPAYRVNTAPEAAALGDYAASLEVCDMYVIAEKPVFITAARTKCNALYGMLEVSSFDGNDEVLRASVVAAGARGAILSAQHADRDTVSYLQDRHLVVWQTVTASDISAVSAINNGVLGLVTPDVKATEACFTKYYTKGTVTRTPEILGHRGAPTLAQENSLAGAVKAFEVGASVVECDVYLLKDGNIVIMHDDTLDRTTNGTGNTVAQTVESLKNIKIDSLAGVAAEPIPLLDDYLKKFQGTGKVIAIELKDEDKNIAEPLVNTIKKYNMQKQVVFISFYADMIEAVRKIDPTISATLCATSIYADEAKSLEITQKVLDRVIPANTSYSPSQSRGTLGVNFFNDLAARGVTVWTFTVNNQNKFDSFFVSGVLGMTTNYPQWAGPFIEDFRAQKSADGKITLSATTYKGEQASTLNADLVVIGGEGSYDAKSGHVTISEGAQGFFFSLTKYLSSGLNYTVVTPVFAASEATSTGTPTGSSGGNNTSTIASSTSATAANNTNAPTASSTSAVSGTNPDNGESTDNTTKRVVNVIEIPSDDAKAPNIWLIIGLGVAAFVVTTGVLLIIFRKQIFG